MGDTVPITASDGGRFTGYLSRPKAGTGPGLVLIQEIFGVNAVMRGIADWYAGHGFTVLCPDLFWRQKPGVELSDRSPAEWQQGVSYMKGMAQDAAVADVAAALNLVRSHPGGTGKAGETCAAEQGCGELRGCYRLDPTAHVPSIHTTHCVRFVARSEACPRSGRSRLRRSNTMR